MEAAKQAIEEYQEKIENEQVKRMTMEEFFMPEN